MSEKAKDLLSKMIEYDPNKRITVNDALNHSYFVEDLSFTKKYEKILEGYNEKVDLNTIDKIQKQKKITEVVHKKYVKENYYNINNKIDLIKYYNQEVKNFK